jgi:hypothetical protein
MNGARCQNFTTRPADRNNTFLIVPIQPQSYCFTATNES